MLFFKFSLNGGDINFLHFCSTKLPTNSQIYRIGKNVNGFFLIKDFFWKISKDVENPLKFKFWSFSFQNYPKVRIFSSINLKVFQIRPRKSSFLDESWFRIFQKVTLKTNPFLLKMLFLVFAQTIIWDFMPSQIFEKKCKTLKLLASQLCCNLSST